MKVGFTGSRKGMSQEQVDSIIKFLTDIPILEVHHGDCVGADEQFHDICDELNTVSIFIHPPSYDSLRAYCKPKGKGKTYFAKPYLDRNKDIVKSCDVLIACPLTDKEEFRSGTWSTIRYAKKLGKMLLILPQIELKDVENRN